MMKSTLLLALVVVTAIPEAMLAVIPVQQLYYTKPTIYEGEELYQSLPQRTVHIWDDAMLEPEHSRVRRQSGGGLTVDATRTQGGGTLMSAQGSGTVWRSADRQSQVDLNGHVSRVYGGPGGNSPPTYGGGASYNHNGRGGVGVDVSRTPGYGTQLSAQAQANLWRSRNGMSSLDATGSYSRNFGGPYGTGRPNYGGFLNFNHRF
uniref:Attacin C-terminal domain-containing protein n=1 Tax=Timema genevievae TaxID=629358 RepID=A0A7R9JRV0_TIMGE|nr:unnamed protein product [Timema genevievae]